MNYKKYIRKIIEGLPEGVLSIILFFTNKKLFGISNAIIATYMTLTFTNMRKNIYIESNAFKNYLIHITLGIFASLATQNLFATIVINFVVISLASYLLTREYDSARYFAFLLGFVVMQLIPIKLNDLYLRILAITYSYLMVRIFLRIFSRNRLKNNIYKLINESFNSLRKELLYAKESNFKAFKVEEDNLSKVLGDLNRIILESYEKEYFDLIIICGQFNNFNKRILNRRDLAKKNEKLIEKIKDVLDYSERISSSESLLILSKKIEVLLNENKEKSTFNNCLDFMVKYIIETSSNINKIEKNRLKKFIRRNSEKDLSKEKITLDRYRVRFAIRIGILLSFGFALNKIFEFPKEYWLPLSIYVMAFPYYEDSKKRIRERIFGTSIGLMISFLLFYIFRTRIDHKTIIIFATILMFSIDSYITKSIYTTLYAMAITSFSMNPDEAIILRFFYTMLGGIVAFIGNRFILPNKSNIEIKKSLESLVNIDLELLINIKKRDNKVLFDCIRNTYLNNNKLNKLLNEEDSRSAYIKDIMLVNNEFINDVVYIYILIDSIEVNEFNEENIKNVFTSMRNNLSLKVCLKHFKKESLNSSNLDLNYFILESFNKEETLIKKIKKTSNF